MGVILWEDSIQQFLLNQDQYAGVTATPIRVRPGVNAPPGHDRGNDRVHLQRATRRSPYFAHTRTGEKYARRRFVPVVAQESWGWKKGWGS